MIGKERARDEEGKMREKEKKGEREREREREGERKGENERKKQSPRVIIWSAVPLPCFIQFLD